MDKPVTHCMTPQTVVTMVSPHPESAQHNNAPLPHVSTHADYSTQVHLLPYVPACAPAPHNTLLATDIWTDCRTGPCA